jgi:hypothetical protein
MPSRCIEEVSVERVDKIAGDFRRLVAGAAKVVAVLLTGYVVCFIVAVLWSQQNFVDGFTPGAMWMTAIYVLFAGAIPMSLTVLSLTVISLHGRNKSCLAHFSRVIVTSLLLAGALNVFVVAFERLLLILFVSAFAGGIAIAWATRKLFRAKVAT